MPIFEVCCKDCGFQFETYQKFSDPNNPTCRRCGGRTKRMISKSNFVLVGEGWAKDNYKGVEK